MRRLAGVTGDIELTDQRRVTERPGVEPVHTESASKPVEPQVVARVA